MSGAILVNGCLRGDDVAYDRDNNVYSMFRFMWRDFSRTVVKIVAAISDRRDPGASLNCDHEQLGYVRWSDECFVLGWIRKPPCFFVLAVLVGKYQRICFEQWRSVLKLSYILSVLASLVVVMRFTVLNRWVTAT